MILKTLSTVSCYLVRQMTAIFDNIQSMDAQFMIYLEWEMVAQQFLRLHWYLATEVWSCSPQVFTNGLGAPFGIYIGVFALLSCHSSEIRGLCLMKCPSETLQNLIYFLEYKNPCSFFRFSFRATLFFLPNECPGLYQHRPGHSYCKNIKLHKMKNENN